MDWERLIAEFRSLGGIAENVRLGEGPLGRGVFVVDPSLPATLYAPENLLVPASDLQIREGRLSVKPTSTLGQRERAFFEAYQQLLGWSAGLFDELWQAQRAWNELPPDVVDAIATMGALEDPDMRFRAPSVDVCLYLYKRTRHFAYGDTPHIAPMIELVNHSMTANGHAIEPASRRIGVKGTFASEMLARYTLFDPWGQALMYGFAERGVFGHSLTITVDVDGKHQVVIARDIGSVEVNDGVRLPKRVTEGTAIRLPYLTLGFAAGMDVPRAVFRKVLTPELSTAQADDAFETILYFNRSKFVAMLRTLRAHDGPLVRMLEEAAINQLEVLSCTVGAKAL